LEFFGERILTQKLLIKNLVSISSTSYPRVFQTKVLFCQNVTKEKAALLYEKFLRKMLMKLTPEDLRERRKKSRSTEKLVGLTPELNPIKTKVFI